MDAWDEVAEAIDSGELIELSIEALTDIEDLVTGDALLYEARELQQCKASRKRSASRTSKLKSSASGAAS
ncbi:MAG TPA: hypothetical protein VE998_06380 [Terriglobales bacterium]|nr:hypothetical protein [Terriglobales bacterium]